MSVEVRHLFKSIGRTEILRDVSLSIPNGQVVGLLGPNGAGKSTLMKILTGLWSFNSGEVEVCGIAAEEGILPHAVTYKIGYLPENNPLYNDMYVREYLRFMAKMSMLGTKFSRDDLEQLIERVSLQDMANKRIGSLSKGYRQRVGLAAAMLAEPELLILDEPTTGLDPNQLDEIRALIKDLGQNRTIILSTHILQEVEAMCSRVIILSRGEVRDDTTDLSLLEERFREKTK